MRIAIIGTGYVGLVTGAGFSDFGHDVVCVDVNEKRIAQLTAGAVPFYEPGLQDLLRRNRELGRLHFSTEMEAVRDAQIVFIAVGTPSSPDGSADLSSVFEAATQIARRIAGFTVVVTKSTVPVGTARRLRALMSAETDRPFAVASNPEFLKEGDAVADFLKPARVIVGVDDPRAADLLRELYRGVVRTNDRVQVMDLESAELTKYAANAMLATRISFMNELALLCERVGADIESVRKGIGADPRIGNKFLFAGAGFGGSCLVGSETALIRQHGTVRLSTMRDLLSATGSPHPHVEHPEGLEVLSWTPDARPEFRPVVAVTRRGYEGELLEIRTKMGRRITCTPDHPFVARTGESWEMTAAADLTVDHWLPISVDAPANAEIAAPAFDVLGSLLALGVEPEHVIVRIGDSVRSPENTEALRAVVRDGSRLADIRKTGTLRLHEARAANLDLDTATIGTSRSGTYIPTTLANTPELWHVIGLYCSEGWITTDIGRDGARRMRIGWAFHPRDEEHLVEEVVAFWERLGIKASVFSPPTSRKVSVSSRLLATWLVRVLGVGVNCYDQRIPDALWSAPESHKRAFLSGLWMGDGSWSYVTNRRGVVLEYGTASREIADGVVRLLAELGIVASWKIGRPPGSTVPTHFVRISGADQVEQLLELCHAMDREKVRASINSQHRRIAPTGYKRDAVGASVRVVDIQRRHFQGTVYSMHVPGAETFCTTGGLVVHNCFPKDLRALIHAAEKHNVELSVVTAVNRSNERQKRVLGERISAHFDGALTGKRIGIWGLAFKPETDDIRESPALELIEFLVARGASVVAYDPVAIANVRTLGLAIELANDAYAVATGADALVLVTEWHEFRNPDLARLRHVMKSPALFDGRNVWSPSEASAHGLTYYGIGRPFERTKEPGH